MNEGIGDINDDCSREIPSDPVNIGLREEVIQIVIMRIETGRDEY